jgi:putative hydrolase of HD superfamily
MDDSLLRGRLAFVREAERLKDVLRSAHTSKGRKESTAEHSWRLCLLAMAFEDQLRHLDFALVLKICVVHDLGEALGGDIPAVDQVNAAAKSEQERSDLSLLLQPLEPSLRADFLALWQEYEDGATPEAQAVKALDKLETILQHNQGANPANFDYAFNLGYGSKATACAPLFLQIRAVVDEGTRQRMAEINAPGSRENS